MGSRIGVIESEPLALEGISAVLARADDFALAGAWADAGAAISGPPLQLLADMTALGDDPLAAVTTLSSAGHVVVIRAATVDVELAHILIESGAYGVVARGAPCDEMLDALRATGRGERYVPRDIRGHLERRWIAGERSLLTVLTRREREVMALVGGGMSAQAISLALFIALPTVRTHLRQAYVKLGVNSNAAAVFELTRLGLVRPQTAGDSREEAAAADTSADGPDERGRFDRMMPV